MKYFTLGRNEICYCESGKKYKKCCGKNAEFEKLYDTGRETFQGKKIIFDRNKDDRLLSDVQEFEKNAILIDRSKGFEINNIKKLTENEGIDYLNELYEMFDSEFNYISKYASCKKGCNSCCNTYVDTTPLEAENILRYINNNLSQEERNLLKQKIQKNASQTISQEEVFNNPEIKFEHFNKNLSCPFLNSDGECTIYEVRPLNCRKMIVYSDPIKCYQESDNVNYISSSFTEQSVFTLSKLNASTYGRYFHAGGGIINTKHISQWLDLENDMIN